MNKLTTAREFCFQYLFHLQLPIFEGLRSELIAKELPKQLDDSITEFKESTNTLLDDDLNKIVSLRIRGILDNYQDLEDLIEKNLKNWKLSRISKTDHTTLLLATYELIHETKTPKKVIINEAVEIAKKFGAENSAKFINGVLDNIAKSN